MMNIIYSPKQKQIYSTYSGKSDQQLFSVIQDAEGYNKELVDIVFEILQERGYSHDSLLDAIRQVKENEAIYTTTADLLLKREMGHEEVVKILEEKGVSLERAEIIINDIRSYVKKENGKIGNKNMLYGALWLVGGIIASAAELGYVFWGAIVFGAYQFIRGASSN